ncbi:MAG: PAS domain-containing sensor histidine kinase [Opitutus sp.]|nr:PAS domain-containing sensor histidine kinase [Opitutus sp.]
MSETTSSRSSVTPTAVLLLDAAGRVTAANTTAHSLWQTGTDGLVGKAFASLFIFEIVSSDPDFLEAQWDVVLASALDRAVTLGAQPPGGTPRDVSVRIEKIGGTATGYFATVQPSVAAPTAMATPDHDDAAAGLQLLAEKSAAGFFDLNLKSGRVQFSPVWKKMLGYAAAELPDMLATWHALIHPDDSGAAPDKISKKVSASASARGTASTRPFSVEFRMKHQRGHWAWIQSVGVQGLTATGELERVVGIHLDISERKEIEDTLVANDTRFQDLSNNGPLAAFELDFANGVFWFSPAWESLLGYDEGELAAEAASFGAALPAEEASAGVEAWLLNRAPGQSAFAEAVRFRAKDGRPVPVLFGAHRTVSRKRELLRIVGFACHVPAGAAAEEGALPVVLVNEAFGSLAEGVIVTDARGRIVFANAVAARLVRIDPFAVRGQPVGDVFRLVNRQSNRPGDDPAERALSADQPLPLISDDALAPAAAGGTPLPVVWTARAAFGPDGKPQGVVIVFRDPDEMTLTPEELVKANRFESLGLLAGGIAHDFNNLLTTILGAVSLAKDNHDYTALGDAEQACMTAKGLTKQLLSFAKGGAGSQAVCSPKEILDDSIKIAAAASTAEVMREYADAIENVLVDRPQILQVFQNLMVNALQAMPPPPHRPRLQIRAANIRLTDNQVPALAEGDYVEFEVRDNGSGIKPEYVEKIFDPFFTTKKHGTGLGLATVLSVVRKHGGQIGLDTQVGVGTAFTVYLPKAEKPIEVQARRAASLRFGTGRVLFMDDDPKISTLTATMLESLDYKFDLAKNGEEAIAFYKRYQNIGRPYDAVIMDLTVVGGMGGEECFFELKKLDADVRAIVASGYDNDEMARQFLEKGFCGYLTKPYRVTDLGKVLKAVLG